eukprot:2597127-Pleurochrysis_carterae.AAC.1
MSERPSSEMPSSRAKRPRVSFGAVKVHDSGESHQAAAPRGATPAPRGATPALAQSAGRSAT